MPHLEAQIHLKAPEIAARNCNYTVCTSYNTAATSSARPCLTWMPSYGCTSFVRPLQMETEGCKEWQRDRESERERERERVSHLEAQVWVHVIRQPLQQLVALEVVRREEVKDGVEAQRPAVLAVVRKRATGVLDLHHGHAH